MVAGLSLRALGTVFTIVGVIGGTRIASHAAVSTVAGASAVAGKGVGLHRSDGGVDAQQPDGVPSISTGPTRSAGTMASITTADLPGKRDVCEGASGAETTVSAVSAVSAGATPSSVYGKRGKVEAIVVDLGIDNDHPQGGSSGVSTPSTGAGLSTSGAGGDATIIIVSDGVPSAQCCRTTATSAVGLFVVFDLMGKTATSRKAIRRCLQLVWRSGGVGLTGHRLTSFSRISIDLVTEHHASQSAVTGIGFTVHADAIDLVVVVVD